jgi:hypothetical protein
VDAAGVGIFAGQTDIVRVVEARIVERRVETGDGRAGHGAELGVAFREARGCVLPRGVPRRRLSRQFIDGLWIE